jgi:hypothetical protein
MLKYVVHRVAAGLSRVKKGGGRDDPSIFM